ncbi:MAG: rRNA pseudouridine synthase [Acidobacteriota bacterium]|jgi:23S rRNA pseudouridine2605 synthase|nr:rRNA pseudouridine synthase [Acidobacteriota bacterium]
MNQTQTQSIREERLQKIIAAAGVTSRRKAELLIQEGRVTVNGQTVTELGAKADPENDSIRVDGRRIRASQTKKVYILLNKPKQVMSTVSDPQGRAKVTDLVPAHRHLFPVGRLDYNTEGLILLTNDGEFAKIVSSAGRRFPKVYHVKVRSTLDEETLFRLCDGIRIDGEHGSEKLAPCQIEPLKEAANSWYEVTLFQGRNRQIRSMFEAVGHPVQKLRRVRIGFLTDKGLAVGRHRALTQAEVDGIVGARRAVP